MEINKARGWVATCIHNLETKSKNRFFGDRLVAIRSKFVKSEIPLVAECAKDFHYTEKDIYKENPLIKTDECGILQAIDYGCLGTLPKTTTVEKFVKRLVDVKILDRDPKGGYGNGPVLFANKECTAVARDLYRELTNVTAQNSPAGPASTSPQPGASGGAPTRTRVKDLVARFELLINQGSTK